MTCAHIMCVTVRAFTVMELHHAAANVIQQAIMRHYRSRVPHTLRTFQDMMMASSDDDTAVHDMVRTETECMQQRAYFDDWVVNRLWLVPSCWIGYCAEVTGVRETLRAA